jgi:AhpC/TSA family protein
LPSVNALYNDYKARGLEVRLIAFRESADVVRRAATERGYTAPVLLDESGDTSGRVYGVWGPPTVYLIDRQGRLVGRAAGPRAWESPAAHALIEALLASS